jgi:hypothetical protein
MTLLTLMRVQSSADNPAITGRVGSQLALSA